MMLRKTAMKSIFIVLGIAALSLGANAEPLNLSQGTWTAGGSAAFTMRKAAGAAFNTSVYGMQALVNPGYFVLDHWEVNLIAGVQMDFNNPSFSFNSVQLGLGTSYYFDLNSIIYPYLGVDVTGLAVTAYSPATWFINVTPRVGMLIGLNCDVALDVGLSAGLSWAVSNGYDVNGNSVAPNANPGIDAKLGYFGVKGFF